MSTVHSRTDEYVTSFDILRVPHMSSHDKAQKREGWEPFFVNINLNAATNGGVEKVVSYKRAEAA